MLIIGCDFHTRFQQITMLHTTTGEIVERRLQHGTSYRKSRSTVTTGHLDLRLFKLV